MMVGIDAGPLLGQGGISEYVRPLVTALVADDQSTQWRLVLRRSWLRHEAAARLEELAPVIRVAIPDRMLSFWWEQLQCRMPLPSRLWNRFDLFLATCGMAPILSHGQVVSIVYDLTPLRLPHLFSERRAFRDRLQQVCRRSAALVAISHTTKNDLVELMEVDPDIIHVVHPGRQEPKRGIVGVQSAAAKRYGIDGPYILYVGSLGPHKNVTTVLSAYQHVRMTGKIDAKLVVVGSQQWGRGTVAAIDALQVKNDVILTGYVSNEDLSSLYSDASLFVFPSLYEGFGLPALEAMAHGTAVVVSNAGALPEVVGPAGLCVDPLDEIALADAMSRVLSDQGLKAAMVDAGLEQAQKFSWDQSATQLRAIFQQVTNRSLVEI